MNRKAFWFFRSVFVVSAMLVLSLGYAQAQPASGFIPVFVDELGNEDSSVIFEDFATGNVGIGTTNPLGLLHVLKDGDFAAARVENYSNIPSVSPDISLLRARGTQASPLPVLSGDILGGVFIGGHAGTGFAERANIVGSAAENWSPFGFGTKLRFFTTQNGTTTPLERVVINHDGNVGIGTTNPTSKLHVVGRVLAGGYDTPSDIRLKEDVTPLIGVLEKLDKIRGVSFKWNAQSEALGQSKGQKDVGVIAQEVQAVFPELVTARGPENYQAVDYSKLTAVLLEAVKELKAEVKELKTENQTLKNRMTSLESK